MTLTIAIPAETNALETRVATVPAIVKKLAEAGHKVQIQSDAGKAASYTDSAYKDAGASITKTAAETLKNADLILKVQAPPPEEAKKYPKNALLLALMDPHGNESGIKALAGAGVNALAMELMPRISRAQSMDVLSSQSNLAGYKAVLDATEHFTRAFPMMMTAAGTIPPAKVFVMGAGVAGLQAIATARRLGAIVTATDVRPASKEQVESLGGKFVAVQDDEFKQAETSGGYAKEMSAAYRKKQTALIEEHIAAQDIVITTALIPGRPAPELVSEAMVKSMKPGSVIVDLAAVNGGNCALTEKGKVVHKHDVTILGHENVPARLATDASALYAKNLLNVITLITDKDTGTLAIDWDDEIIKAIALTKDGKVIHPMFKTAQKPAAKKSPGKKTTPKKTNAKKKTAKTTTKKPTSKSTAKKPTKKKGAAK